MKRNYLIIAGIVIVIAVGAGVLAWKNQQTKPSNNEAAQPAEIPQNLSSAELQKLIDEKKQQIAEKEKNLEEKEAKRQKDLAILHAQGVTEDVAVDGVEVVSMGNKKLVKNNTQGYSMEVPADLVIAKSLESNYLNFFRKGFRCEERYCPPLMIIQAFENPQNLPAKQWHEIDFRITDLDWEKIETTLNGQKAYRRLVEDITPLQGEVKTLFYYLPRNKKIYDIHLFNFDKQADYSYIETFKFAN